MIYLDNAATTSPKPQSVSAAVYRAVHFFSANPGRGGHRLSVTTARQIYRARTNIADFFRVPREENVIFTPGCTASLNMVMKGVLKKGDHVIISSMEHNSVLRPLEKLKQMGLVTYSIAAVDTDHDKTVDHFRRQINERTRLILCTHASNVFGTILPIERLCALAHSYGILFCVDAAQSAGVLEINVEDSGFDFVCCAGHKGLYGPMGTGLLLIGGDTLPDTLIEGGTGSASADPLMPAYTPDRYESGTLNVPGILGLSAGVDFVRARGMDSIYRHELSLMRFAYEKLSRISGVLLYTGYPTEYQTAPVLSFSVKDKSSEDVAAYLDQHYDIAVRAGLHCAPLAHRTMGTEERGTVRVSPSVFTSRQDIQILVNAVNKFVQFT
jgi:cysteine desulfurase family protein